MIKKISLIFIIILFISGCSYYEINDLGIINQIGLTKEKELYVLDINIIKPQKNNTYTNEQYRVKSKTIENAFDNIYTLSNKITNLSQLELIVLDKNLNKKDYDELMKFTINNNSIRNTFNVIILDNYNEEIIKKVNSNEINNLIKNNYEIDGLVKPLTIDQLYTDILNNNTAYIPSIKYTDNFEIQGYYSVYDNNFLLDKESSIAYNYLTNKIKKCNLITDNENIYVTYSKTTIKKENNTLKIVIYSKIKNSKELKNNYINLIKKYVNKFYKNSNKYKLIIKVRDSNE